jgi:NitT/TauT family transport system ATP-binding protein
MVLFVSHDTREVVQLADRVVLLTPSPGAVRAIVPIGMPRAERADPARIEELRRSLLDNRPAIS